MVTMVICMYLYKELFYTVILKKVAKDFVNVHIIYVYM